MNQILQEFARKWLKKEIVKVSDNGRHLFKMMYGRCGGRRSVADTEDMDIMAVIDEMPADKLDWAMTQIQNSKRPA